jgi:exosortase
LSQRTVHFVLLITAAAAISWSALVATYAIAAQGNEQSHILLAVPVSIVLLYCERDKIFRNEKYCLLSGAFIFLGVTLVWLVGPRLPVGQEYAVSLKMFLFVGICIAAFILCYDTTAFRAAAFPLLFLFFMVPIPGWLLERIILLLQGGSADVAFLLLKASQIPVSRQGLVLSLPRFDIEVATDCSGIRSSLLLLVVTLVLGHLFLRSNWRKGLLALLVLPIAVAKNGFRIFGLSAIATAADPSFLHGYLHRYGGIPSFAFALGVVMLLVWRLHESENSALTRRERAYLGAGHNPHEKGCITNQPEHAGSPPEIRETIACRE